MLAPFRSRTATAVRRHTRRLLVLNVGLQVAIVVTGGLVRLTGSGLGCPTWPQCVPGSYTPVVHQPQGVHTFIEFGNRLLTFALASVALAVLVAVWRPVPHPAGRLRALAAAPLLGVVAQAGLGGLTVLTGLDPRIVAAHLVVSMALVSVSVVLLDAWDRTARPPPVRDTGGPMPVEARWLAAAQAVTGATVLVLGTLVTGSGPHSGDARAPARFGLDPRTMSWLHADVVLLFVGLTVGMVLLLSVSGAHPATRRAAFVLLLVAVAQGAVGYAQFFTGLPEALVGLHLLGASLLVVALTRLVATVWMPPPGPRPA